MTDSNSSRTGALTAKGAHDDPPRGGLDAEARFLRLSSVLRGIRRVNQLIIRERDPETLIREACDLLVESRGFDSSCIVVCDGDAVRLLACGGAEQRRHGLQRMLTAGELPDCIRRVLGEGDLLVRQDPAKLCGTCPAHEDYQDNRSAVTVRLESGGCTMGALHVSLASDFAADDEELDLLREVAGDIAFALRSIENESDRRQAEVELRLFRELIDQSNDAFEVLDPATGRLLLVNDRACLDLGYSREEYSGLSVFDIDPMVTPIGFAESMEKLRKTGSMMWEGTHRRKDGSTFPVEVNLGYVRLDREFLVAVARDITKRREVEDAVRRSRDTQEVIATILRLSLEDLPLEDLLSKVLGIALSIPWLSVERKGSIMLLEDKPGVLVMKAEVGLDAELRGACARIPFGFCLCGRAASTGQLVYADGLDDRHEQTYDKIAPHGHYCLPISYAGEVLGVLNVYVAAGHARAQQEEDFLGDVANTLAGVIIRRKAVDERRQAEEHLKLSQRLETVGRLAGGVAHDFNNLLTVINSYASFAIEALRESDPTRADIVEIREAGHRAAALTRQLLAFSRKQILEPVVLSPNTVVGDIESMLRRLLGEDIDIVVRLADDLGCVEADPGQLEQVIMNLAVNARDAMTQGGRLTIETANVDLTKDSEGRPLDDEAGRFVALRFTDTGCGMDAATQEHIFEPFFTTKEMGKGTGLGLATVYGIVKQSGGHLRVDSELGHGTVFGVYLPRLDAPATRVKRRQSSSTLRGIETLLVVEDEDAVRRLVERIMRAAGYRVLVAVSGADALALFDGHQGKIDLLLTDVVMPGMSGRELADRLAVLNPKLRTLYMSGYTDDAIVHHGVLDPGTRFLSKPFTAAGLTGRVREVLDEDLR